MLQLLSSLYFLFVAYLFTAIIVWWWIKLYIFTAICLGSKCPRPWQIQPYLQHVGVPGGVQLNCTLISSLSTRLERSTLIYTAIASVKCADFENFVPLWVYTIWFTGPQRGYRRQDCKILVDPRPVAYRATQEVLSQYTVHIELQLLSTNRRHTGATNISQWIW